jgi:hypothetical protein|tara:strand:- start:529 stop:1254 length:726 start_codon:yes stop_codon:yes gene_type:complete
MPGVTHSNTPFATNVFVNGGPTLGGGVANALGIEDTVGISDEQARQIISDRADTISAGLDPDTHEALEQFGGGSPNGTNPVSGQEGAEAAPGSDSATGADSSFDSNVERPTSEWIIVQAHVNPRVLPDVWEKAILFAKSIGRPITLNSAYRSPEYNAGVGGAKKSMHVQRKAIDVQWGTSSLQTRVDMIQLAIDAGFSGVGCYENFIHLDIGNKRQWGPSGGRASQFAQYKPVFTTNGFTV